MTPQKVFAAVCDVMSGPMAWGVSDCSHAADDVFSRVWGVRVMGPDWRGSYDSPFQASRRLAERRMTIDRAWRDAALAAGLAEVEEHPGALGIVQTDAPAFGGLMPAICIRPGEWAARTDGGFGIARAATEVWGLQCRH